MTLTISLFRSTAIISAILFGMACNNSSPKKKSETLPATKEKTMEQNIGKDFGEKYAAAWSGQDAQRYAQFFALDGSLRVNDEAPAVGREAIQKVAQGFMTAFPDMLVSLDSLPKTSKGVEFHWTLTGTNTGPNGTGKKIHISGVEILQFDSIGLITESKGSFDENEYNRQLKYGAGN